MFFDGKFIRAQMVDGHICEATFDNQTDKVNKFNLATLKELKELIEKIKNDNSIKGILFKSSKDTFIVGADVTEFLSYRGMSDIEFSNFLLDTHHTFNSIEDLPIPSVAAINGAAMGGGFELCLACTFRMAADTASVGQPETKLGIIPGWGGTIRLPRLIGADNAIEWIASGEKYSAEIALKNGAVSGVTSLEQLGVESLALLKRAIAGEIEWKSTLSIKKSKMKLNDIEAGMVFEGAKGFVLAKAGTNYTAPLKAIEVMQKGRKLEREEAMKLEVAGFVELIKGPVSESLIRIFLGDMYVNRVAKGLTKNAQVVKKAAALGAGIMGGGVAYQSASTGTPIVMKDIREDALAKGMAEATNLLEKKFSKGGMDLKGVAHTLSQIRPTLLNEDLKEVDLVVEAVVENIKIKKSVLAELENVVRTDTIITSNTSTISITKLAEGLKRPDNFCGMHFFNPVPRMPLVEVIRGKQSSEKAIATTVAYALSMRKTPIVVQDCAGFLVNRVLFPYFGGFIKLLNDGVPFERIDKIMEKFGWPMGPAYLGDVVGIDTAYHANEIMAEAFPDRMKHEGLSAFKVMFEAKRFGQKNGIGFYKYVLDKKGRFNKEKDPAVEMLLSPLYKSKNDAISDDEIKERMMLPMIFESALCVEEKIVATPTEVDIGVVYGLGFPPFRGGVMQYADSIGSAKLVELSKKYQHLGNMYRPNAMLIEMAKNNKKFYETNTREKI